MKFPWDKEVEVTYWQFVENGDGHEVVRTQSIKEILKNFSGLKNEDAMRTICIGLAQVMDYLENRDGTS